VEVFGERLAWLLRGHSSPRTDRRATCIYRTLDPLELREPRYSLQLAFSSPSSLHLAFFVTLPPPRALSLRPHCHLGIYRCQRSPTTRAAASPQRLRQWKYGRRLIDGIDHLDGLGFLISLYSQCFILSFWFSSQCICLALKNWCSSFCKTIRVEKETEKYCGEF